MRRTVYIYRAPSNPLPPPPPLLDPCLYIPFP